MGTVNATLLFAEPNTNWVNATFLCVTSQRSISWATAKRPRGEFPASRGVLILTHPEEVGDDEVKQ